MLNKLLPNLDIWNEILGYFEVSLEEDDEKVVKEKRKAIIAIALLSPKVTELALNALWKNMMTLVPIVNTANSDGEFFDYRVSNGRGCWRVSNDLEITEEFLDGLITNLKRVRSLRVQISEKELELWQMLHALLVPRRSMPYLLPCLQTLSLVCANDPQSQPFLGIISYIFAPSLTSITVSGRWGASWATVHHHMNSHHLPNLSWLRYLDETLGNYLCGIGRLTSLRYLILYDEHQFYDLSALANLSPLRCLQKLVISIQVDEDDLNDPSTVFLTLPELQTLQLKIGCTEAYDLFFQRVKLPSLISLSLSVKHALEQELPLGLLAASYPNLRHLILLCTKTEEHSYIISANDLLTIVDLRGMESLKLINIPHELQEKDIFSLVKSLPDLHSLAITGPETIFSATLLISISQFSNLRCVKLPLDFSLLVDHRSSEKASQSPSQMRKIISPNSLGIPAKSSAKLALIRNMLHLFPKLEELGGMGESMEELRDVFEVVNSMFYKPSISKVVSTTFESISANVEAWAFLEVDKPEVVEKFLLAGQISVPPGSDE